MQSCCHLVAGTVTTPSPVESNWVLISCRRQTLSFNRYNKFLISDFRRDLNIVYFLLGISPASNCNWPTFRNPVSVPSSKAGWTVWHCSPSLWRWNWYRVPKRRPTTIWRRGNTQKKIYNIRCFCFACFTF